MILLAVILSLPPHKTSVTQYEVLNEKMTKMTQIEQKLAFKKTKSQYIDYYL